VAGATEAPEARKINREISLHTFFAHDDHLIFACDDHLIFAEDGQMFAQCNFSVKRFCQNKN